MFALCSRFGGACYQMKPDKLSIHDLFQRDRRYVVPLYQRAYVWNQADQWEPLWEDVERQAESCLEAQGSVATRSHFLGAIVLNVSRIVGAGVARSEIIDGQQRLTTLQIMIAAIRDYAAEIGSDQHGRLRALTVNEYEKAGSEGTFKVWPTNADRELFRHVMSVGSPVALRKLVGRDGASAPRIAAAYFYFSERVREFVAAGHDSEARDRRVFSILQALRTALQLVVIELEDGDDPQVIFETLNARGHRRRSSDVCLRPRVCRLPGVGPAPELLRRQGSAGSHLQDGRRVSAQAPGRGRNLNAGPPASSPSPWPTRTPESSGR